MAFSNYWKEIALVLAGLFAIGGVLSDVKDKKTGKITIWGRAFFTLTVLSVIGGVYAQWIDNAIEEKQNSEAQTNMLTLLQTTAKSIQELSRVLQPIGSVAVNVGLKLDCGDPEFKTFCEKTKAEGKREANDGGKIEVTPLKHPEQTFFKLDKVDWSSFPGKWFSDSLELHLFKNEVDAQDYLDHGVQRDSGAGDIYIEIDATSPNTKSQPANVRTIYEKNTGELEFYASVDSVTPIFNNGRMVSTLDLPNSTGVITSGGLLDVFSLSSIGIDTNHGPGVFSENLQAAKFHYGSRVYRFQIPSSR